MLERRCKMAKETQIGQLGIDLKKKTEAHEKGLETTKKKLQEVEKQNEQVQSSNGQLDASFIAMSASIVASLVKIKSAVDDGVEKYNKYTNSMQALQKTAKATNNSMSDITKAMENIELSPQQIQDGERLRKNMFKTFYKVEKNTQNY